MTRTNEEEWIKQLKNPSEQRLAFEQVVRVYSSQIYWQIRRMVLSHDDANDLLQNTFLKAWIHLDSFRGDAKLSTWLYRIAMNECLSFLQTKRNFETIDDLETNIAEQLESDTYFNGEETDIMLQQALSELPEKQRVVFNLKYYEEMKYEEMSDVLQTSVGALKASYHFAVKKIETFFKNRD
ncbi:MAG: sigma-70 family RNA polymerase sigma factor [Bacteroidaceae bacterium]